jgi:1-acyl-sn-glycerol-3-phosphate acyltransferase
MLFNLGRFLFKIFYKTFFRLEVSGLKNIPRGQGFILASNHVSYLDPTVLGVACPAALNFMAKEELFKNPFFGWILRKVHAFPLRRGAADLSAIKEAMRRVKRGQALLIFPEGTRQAGGKLGQPQAGIGFLAEKLSVPIVPAFVRGTDKALGPGAKFIRLQKISVHFGKQIDVERRPAYQDTAFKVMEAIRHLSCLESN